MKKRATVSLCMIVKNEEKFLKTCLDSVKDIVDEMIIVDTGSTDNTVEIAEKFNAKVFSTTWNNSFAEARNVSLSKATKEWILIMDADDVFEEKDKPKFKDLINNGEFDGYFFKTLSYVIENNKNDYIYNSNIRLIKNNGEYEFKGAIHEQLLNKYRETDHSRFKLEDIRIHHNGYLKSVVKEKNKRERNIPIIKEELKKNPNNPFHNFNLGNEYLALGDLEEALHYYNISYNNIQIESGYANKLIIKRISCYIELGGYDIALREIESALNIYPNSTDLHFYKAYLHQKQKKYTLAIKEFNKCLDIGDNDSDFMFINGCGSFRSYFALGDIYLLLKDYEEAIINYEKSIKTNNKNPLVYYKLGTAYTSIYNDNEKIVENMKVFFNLDSVNDLILFSLVLSNCSIYDYSLQLLMKAQKIENSDRVLKEIGKNLIYTNRYKEAIDILKKIPNGSLSYDEVESNIIIAKLLLEEPINLEEIISIKNVNIQKSLLGIYFVYKTGESPTIAENTEQVLKESIKLLEIILKAKEVLAFEKILNILNYIESDKVLLELAKLYRINNYNDLAVEEVIRSIKEFEVIDKECSEILYFCLV